MSLTPEEQAAIKRLRSDGFTNIERQPWRRDLREAARIALRDYPADDNEPVTAEWLLSVWFSRTTSGYLQSPVESGNNILAGSVFWYVKGDGCVTLKCKPETRGDVRRLCRALGIELKG